MDDPTPPLLNFRAMRHPHRTRRAASLRTGLVGVAVALSATLGLVALAPAATAFAGDPVSLDGRYIVDESGVLGSDQSRVQDALDNLATERGVNLFVVYTDEFTNPSDRQAWASDVAQINQFGTNDVLLAVATDDRVYQLSVDSDFALSDNQLATIENDDIVPALRNDDWAGAAIGAAQGIDRELGGGGGGGDGGGATDSTLMGVGGFIWLIAILIVVAVAALLAVFLIRRRRKIDATVNQEAAVAGPTQKELDQRVGAVLIDLDDAVTTSTQELGFAVAQFGPEATKSFSTVLAEVKSSLSQAFALKQKLDDAVPDTDEERRAWSEQIIALCDEAADKLDDQADAFTALRDVERDPAPVLETAEAELAALAGVGTEAREGLARLGRNYDAPALLTVSGSVEQADSLRAFAENELGAASASITAGDTAQAALHIRNARQAVAQAHTVIDAITTLEANLAQASDALAATLADADQDLAEVQRLHAAGDPAAAGLAPLAAVLEVEVQRARSVGGRDPMNAKVALDKADAPLDQALAAVRGEQERVARLAAQRDRAITTAQSEIHAAQSYLETRRGAVGADARTRLSEAQRHLDVAISIASSDPETSLREATSASQLAARASASAHQDVSWAQTGSGPMQNSGGGGDFSGALLGGIIGSLLGGGGGGRSSGGLGGLGGLGGFGGGSSGWGGGSRGGGSRRSSGGGFSGGGGRRGGGGRF